MRAGDLRDVVKILKPVIRVSEYGTKEITKEYTEVMTTRCRKRFKGGGVSVSAKETFYSSAVVFSFYPYFGKIIKAGYQLEDKDGRYRVVAMEQNVKYRCFVVNAELIND